MKFSPEILALTLLLAALVHLIAPQVFLPALPSFIPAPVAVITITGLIELVAAAALFYRPWRRLVSIWLAIYFAALVPIHLFVAWNRIEIFGIASPVVLWARAFFQIFFILWALQVARASPPWTRGWTAHALVLAAAYNVGFGLWAIFFPAQAFEAVKLAPPNYPELWQCIGMIVGVYGVGYAVASHAPERHWPIVLVGLLGKVFGPLGFCYSCFRGSLPLSFGAILLTNDLIWWLPFSAILVSAIKARRKSASPEER